MSQIRNHSANSSRKSGYILVTMAGAAFAIMGAVGLTVDMGRLFTIKTEAQAYTDAAALAAAIQLDGKSTGITAANDAVTATNNSWKFNTTAMPTPTVEFATNSAGPWSTNPGNPTGYIYARVSVTVSAPLSFLPAVMPTKKYTQSVKAYSVAAQIEIESFGIGASPYTAVAQGQNAKGPNFGMTVGNEYDIQWPQFNGSKKECNTSGNTNNGNGNGKSGSADGCFNEPPCDGDSTYAKNAVAANWGAENNGYWGFQSNADIKAAVLDGLQNEPIWVGKNIQPILSNGNKAAEAQVLDLRVSQDASNATETDTAYLADPTHNGRRLMVVPVVDPISTTETIVLGFAQILLMSNGANSDFYKDSQGNQPFCAIYVGPYVHGGNDPGGATSGNGAYRVKLTE